MFSTDNRFEISVSISLLIQNLPLLVESFALFSTDNRFETSVSILLLIQKVSLFALISSLFTYLLTSPCKTTLRSVKVKPASFFSLQVFAVDKKGKLNYMWQAERHGTWHSWTTVTSTQSKALTTLARVVDDKTGWWVAFGVSEYLSLT